MAEQVGSNGAWKILATIGVICALIAAWVGSIDRRVDANAKVGSAQEATLARIDERTERIKEDVAEIKDAIKELE